ncbi:hypothetical protein FRC17_006067 [Serendipita sp. 399]|nr:hypothetical protein FRC17_006067 [Serendipita sp. 399]
MARALEVPEGSFPLDHSLTSAPQVGSLVTTSLDPGNDISAILDGIPEPSPLASLSNPLDVIFSSDYQSLMNGFSPSSTSNSDMLSRIHTKKRYERTTVDKNTLIRAFGEDSPYPNPKLRRLLEAIPRSQFYRNQEPEPRLSSTEASQLLMEAGTPELADDAPGKASLYALFVDRQTKTCLVCNKSHSVLDRALGCVRSHLLHRPFACTGCNACARSHHTLIRIGGMPRHYASRHPDDEVPNMKEERKQRSASSSPL